MLNNKQKIMKVFAHILVLLIPFLLEKCVFINETFSTDRCLLIGIILEFITLNFTIDREKLWNYIYKRRYALILLIFGYFVINGYHGSSIGFYNELIQPNNSITDGLPFVGQSQLIRSDEYTVDTPTVLSNAKYNNLNKISNKQMGMDMNMEIFPHAPVLSVSMLTKPHHIGFAFLPIENGFSFYFYFLFFVCFISLFEFFMIVSKNKKLVSLFGSVLICFSSSLLWWNSFTFLTYGLLAFHFFRQLLISNSWKKKMLFSILLGWAGSCYILILYPAWQLTYGYLFLGLFIWQIVDNKKKISIKDLVYILPCVLTILLLVLPQLLGSINQVLSTMNTEYPGARHEIGGSDWKLNFMYLPSLFYAFIPIDNPCELSQTFSLYPLPIIVSAILVIKKKKDVFLRSLLVVTIFLSIFNYFKVPTLSNITFMYMVQGKRITIVVGIICVMLMVRTISHYEDKDMQAKKILFAAIGAITSVLLSVYLSYMYIKEMSTLDYYGIAKIIISIFVFFIFSFLYLINNNRINKLFMCLFIIFTLASSSLIFPISKGLSVLYDKPVSQKIGEIVVNNEDAKWLTVDTAYQVPNFILANGARVINSVNYTKNSELWDIVDPNGENNYFYNRYAHLLFSLTTDKTSYNLIQSDLLQINLNEESVCDVEIEYILSGNNLLNKNLSKLKLKEEYSEDGIYIYKTLCD